jgi:hypothetical protein
MTIALNSVINWKVLGMMESFQRICFGHAFFKASSFVVVEIISKGLKYVSIKSTQINL